MIQRFLTFLFILSGLTGYGQVGAKIGMSPVLSFTPASATTPSSTVTFSNNINFTAYVKNYGNAAFSGSITVQAKRDTATFNPILDSVTIGATLQPNDSVSVGMSFTPNQGPAAFKSGGNGNTIVVWPLIITGTGVNGDSVRPVIWINDINSVFEFEKNQFKLYPNPVINDLTIKVQSNNQYKNIIIYDVFARKVKELTFKETINVSELNAGSYWMIINSENKSYRINFIKE